MCKRVRGYPEALNGQIPVSGVWTRAAYVPAGVYRFVATMDDGMRVWIDGLPIIDAWGASAEHTVSKDVPLAEGWHNIRVDYQERGGMAVARFNWSPVSGGNTYPNWKAAVSYTHLRAHETVLDLVCRLLLEKKQRQN